MSDLSFSRLMTHDSRLFIFLMQPMAAAATAEFLELKPSGRVLFVLCRHVITLFALGALQNNVISRHKSSRFESRLQAASFSRLMPGL